MKKNYHYIFNVWRTYGKNLESIRTHLRLQFDGERETKLKL
jgi:hypothetical protein